MQFKNSDFINIYSDVSIHHYYTVKKKRKKWKNEKKKLKKIEEHKNKINIDGKAFFSHLQFCQR